MNRQRLVLLKFCINTVNIYYNQNYEVVDYI